MIKFGHKGQIVEIIPEELAVQLVHANTRGDLADLLQCLNQRFFMERLGKSGEHSATLTRIIGSLDNLVEDLWKLK
jgi:hypothetical protein